MNLKRVLSLALLLVFVSGVAMGQMKREDIDAKYKWNLNDIYPSWEAWESDLTNLSSLMEEIAGLKGSLKSAESILKISKLQDELGQLAFKIYRYPQLARDLNTRNTEVLGKLQRVQAMFAQFGTSTAWINPEMLEIPEEKMMSWLDSTPELAPYRFGIEDLYRQQKHVLDEDKERMLSFYSQFNQTPRGIYSELSTSDIKFPEVELSTGTEVASFANYSKTLSTNRNQDDRKKMFEAHYKTFDDQKNTYAAIYNAVCQRNWANAQARKYESSLKAALDGNNIPEDVYTNLIKTVRENTAPLKKYIELRKKVLGLKEYHTYDGSIPLSDFDKTYKYEDARKMVYESVAPLGEDYQAKMQKAMENGWLDVFETENKRAGAYSAGVYGVHPYMLLNYNETLDNFFTLAHELGHTLHTLLSNQNQPFATSGYTIFVAEVASTFNENLLLDYLLERTEDPHERIALLQQAIRNITGTFFFQTLLADYEYQVHQLVEQGQPVTPDVLDGIMKQLFVDYYGEGMVHDDLVNTVWARISHFYNSPFYVYQYATCFVSSAKLYKELKAGDFKPELREKYLDLLRSGGNDYPMEQLKKAGVDLSQPETIMAVINQLDKLVNQLEVEVGKVKS